MATAWTYRDSMVFAAIGGKSGLEDAIQAFSGIPKFREASREAIALESRVLAQEVALQSPAQAYSNRSWKNAFGEQGLDPWGSLETIAKATPADIARVATQQFDARGMAIAVVGDIDVKGLTGKAKQAFEAATASEWPVIQIERKRIEGESLSGGVTVDLPPAGTADWIAKVGAALSFSEADTSTSSSFFSISFRPGLLSIFPKPKIGDSSRPDFGRSMFLNWLDTIERNALSRATVTAQLAIVAPDLSIDRLRADAGALSVSAFSDAAKEFAK
ncbi:MAG: hypothetical protein HONBIEJF_00060 [Fimbriimonadaceae bacterium]|nr:hypothetical protein [Fimbriimonadaceae bacterium]